MNLKVTKEVCDVRMCFTGVRFYRGLWKMFQEERGVVTIYGLTLMLLQHLMVAQSHIKKIQSTIKQKPTKYFIAQGFNTLNRGRLQNILQGSIVPKATQYYCVCGFHYSSFHLVSRNACSLPQSTHASDRVPEELTQHQLRQLFDIEIHNAVKRHQLISFDTTFWSRVQSIPP